MLTSGESVLRAGIDAAAIKPAECDVREAASLAVNTVAIDYEGREHLPSTEVLERLAREKQVYVTTPVRADGFDPLGDDSLARRLPDSVGRIVVAGHPAYLSAEERTRAVAPRLKAGVDAADGAGATDAWVGTESVERLALATGATQFELLSRRTERDLRALRAAGFEGEIAVYAPTVLADDEDEVLDAVGAYVSRRRPVAEALPEDATVDRTATGRAREVLSKASRDFALVGSVATVAERVAALERAGADRVVGYPARGLDEFRV